MILTQVLFHYNTASFIYCTSTYFINNLCILENMLICMIYKYTNGGMYVSDTRCLNACFLTQFYFMFYVNDKMINLSVLTFLV